MHRRRKPRSARTDPTPDDLRIVLDFLNTRDLRSESDELEDTAALDAWLARHSLAPADAPIGEDDWKEALNLRAALQCLLYGHSGGAIDEKAVRFLNQMAGEMRYRVRFDRDGTPHSDVVAEGGWPGARARILEAILRAQSEDRWSRLKICREKSCRYAFYDASNNRSAKWCRVRRCGDRLSSLAYRKRYPKIDEWRDFF